MNFKRIDKIDSFERVLIYLFALIIYFLFAEIVLSFITPEDIFNDTDYYVSLSFTDEEQREAQQFKKDLASLGDRIVGVTDTIVYKYKPAKTKSFTINSLGFRGKEIEKKGANEYRIMFLGASRLIGLFLSEKNTIPVIVENDLKEHFKEKEITVLNFGVEGFDLQRGIATAELYCKDLGVDLAVFCFGINDLHFSYNYGNIDWEPFKKDEEPYQSLMKIKKITQKKWYQKSRLLNILTQIFLPVAKDALKSINEFSDKFFSRMEKGADYLSKDNVETMLVLQPVIQFKGSLSKLERHVLSNYEFVLPGYNSYVLKSVETLSNISKNSRFSFEILDQTRLFENYDESIFYDGVHLTPSATKVAAHNISEKLIEFLEKRFSKLDFKEGEPPAVSKNKKN